MMNCYYKNYDAIIKQLGRPPYAWLAACSELPAIALVYGHHGATIVVAAIVE
jgi:hypothetical protein